MAYKNILVHVDASKHCEARLQFSASLARSFGAHITGLFVSQPVDISPFLADQFPPGLLDEAHARVAQRRDEAKALFDRIMAGMDKPDWVTTSWDDPPEAVSFHARYADLTILGQTDPDEPGLSQPDLPERVALAAGGPVLMIPYAGSFTSLGKRALVAWNESVQSARAVHDALPLLARAEQVTVLSVEDEALGKRGMGPVPDADIAAYFTRHGIKATISRIPAGGIETGDLLLSSAADEAADFLVMGVYGHSRLRELVLGGASRQILAAMTLPVLMSH